MLFFETTFIFLFLPVVLIVYLTLRNYCSQRLLNYYLIIISLIFYSCWNIYYLPLLIISIVFNFFMLYSMNKYNTLKIYILIFGIIVNLSVLIYFKYIGMVIDLMGYFNSFNNHTEVLLPLGISFFTFLQIAFLVDAYRQGSSKVEFTKFTLFVVFFPHLIAGPLVHHSQLIPQFNKKQGEIWKNLSLGMTVFAIGLFKKLVLAIPPQNWADTMFTGASSGVAYSSIDAWTGIISFTLLIYFDFSAYSDMALGLSLLFGIKLPINFNSPYKSASIIEFWRRWHITLSNYLRDYLYFSLGGSRKGLYRQYVNLLIVMLIGGLWHGASWLFVIWGGFHGILLVFNHIWRRLSYFKIPNFVGVFITFYFVALAWIPFRADSINSAINILKGAFFINGTILPTHYATLLPNNIVDLLINIGIRFESMSVYGGGKQTAVLLILLLIVFILPNTQQIMSRYSISLEKISSKSYPEVLYWKPTIVLSILSGAMLAYLMLLVLQGGAGEFIYFQF